MTDPNILEDFKVLEKYIGHLPEFIVAFWVLFSVVFIIFIPINVYFAQRHARLCRKELKKLNDNIEYLINYYRRL